MTSSTPPPPLFTPIKLRELALDNRIVVSPMCQYSAKDGSPTDWHHVHLGGLAMSGASLVFAEATAVEAVGRISPSDTGIYSDDNERAWKRVVEVIRATGTAKIGIQLAHAGRKASCAEPWNGNKQLPLEKGGWVCSAPSALGFYEEDRAPDALDAAGLERVKRAFVSAAKRALAVGFDVVELHMAHGYLLQEFVSPLSNKRTDEYGGSLANRMRFPLEVFAAVREAMPAAFPVGARISCIDWVDGGWTLDDSVAFAKELRARGCDFIDCSSGGNSPAAKIAIGPGYQVPFAARIKRDAGVTTIAVGMITEPQQANGIVERGDADMTALARGMLWDPRWGWHAAEKLGVKIKAPRQSLLANRAVLER
jgi:2,4-dienoyl-CoA reductase-like NADH-dependent reductase (Old Yellow Enzyme family)